MDANASAKVVKSSLTPEQREMIVFIQTQLGPEMTDVCTDYIIACVYHGLKTHEAVATLTLWICSNMLKLIAHYNGVKGQQVKNDEMHAMAVEVQRVITQTMAEYFTRLDEAAAKDNAAKAEQAENN